MSTVPHNSSFSSPEITVPQTPTRKRWSREEYYRLGELGWFQDQRVELINGEIIVLTPQSSQHASVIGQVVRILSPVYGEGYWVRTQLPMHAGRYGEPEPDVSVVQGRPWDFEREHPETASLIIEVSFSSLDYDQKTKSHLYASMNVPDYWVLDLDNRQLIVYRQPIVDEQTQFGHRYEQVTTLNEDGHVTPLENPDAKLAFADMLPPPRQTS